MRLSHPALAAALLATILGCAASNQDRSAASLAEPAGREEDRHYANSLVAVSAAGRYSVELLILGGELRQGENRAELIIHDRTRAEVMGATIAVSPWMSAMGHGVPDHPVVTERGGGLYSVEGIRLTMGGDWELRVEVSGPKGPDTAVFRFDDIPEADPGKGDGHDHGHTGRPVNLDTSTAVLTEARRFRVSFQPQPDGQIPLNRVHRWSVRVETPDGNPITDALISLDGSMPEHGHGMPTKPRVTGKPGDGVYVVDGMKFQMPGWWVVTLRVSSGGTTDTATFNLDLR